MDKKSAQTILKKQQKLKQLLPKLQINLCNFFGAEDTENYSFCDVMYYELSTSETAQF
jgi:hypothetical protein